MITNKSIGIKTPDKLTTKMSKFQEAIVPLLTEAGFKPNGDVWGDEKVYQFEVKLPLGVTIQYCVDQDRIEVYAKGPAHNMMLIGDKPTTLFNIQQLTIHVI